MIWKENWTRNYLVKKTATIAILLHAVPCLVTHQIFYVIFKEKTSTCGSRVGVVKYRSTSVTHFQPCMILNTHSRAGLKPAIHPDSRLQPGTTLKWSILERPAKLVYFILLGEMHGIVG